LNEHAIAANGDWEEYVDALSEISETVTNTKWHFIDFVKLNTNTYEFRQLRNSLIFICGYWEEKDRITKLGKESYKVFTVVFQINLSRQKSFENLMKMKKLVNVDGVGIRQDLTGKGLATIIYKYLVNNLNYTILGDEVQYFGARKLWTRLSKEVDVKVDIIDTNTKKIIFENVILHHGNYDHDFDERLWSYQDDKSHLRSVLTKIL
jgi:hypothetical protein